MFGVTFPVARTTPSRQSAPPISGMATICSGSDGMRCNGVLDVAAEVCHDLQPEAPMRRVTPDAKSIFISGLPCRLASGGRPAGEHLSPVLSLRFQPGPQLNSRSPGHEHIRTYHSCLPPQLSLAGNHRVQRMILPWGHFICEMSMSGMTPIGPRFPVKAILSLRGHHGIRTQIACHSDSIGTDWSSLGPEKRGAEMMKGSVALEYVNRRSSRIWAIITVGLDRPEHVQGVRK